jgi:hypothetical protein
VRFRLASEYSQTHLLDYAQGKLQRLVCKEQSHFPNLEGDKKMIDVFTGLLLVALIGGGFLLARRLFDRRNMMNRPMEMRWQSDYGQSIPPDQGYDSPGYGRPMYDPGYEDPRYRRPAYGPGYNPAGYGRPMYGPGYPPQSGMSPWAAGGLGALGGGLLGYHLGQMAGEQSQQASEGESASPDQMVPLDQGGYDTGMVDVGSPDGGGFADMGADFGGGDFGGIDM